MHSHGPQPGQPGQQPGQQQVQLTPQQIQQLQQMQAQRMQQQQAQVQIDPSIQAAIDESFQQVNFQLAQPNNNVLLCEPHNKQKCAECKVDFTAVNELAARIAAQPNPVPPPPSIVNNQVAQLVTKAKEEGNNHYKTSKYDQAVKAYSVALGLSSNRHPWEPAQTTREEVAICLSNRSAAYMGLGDYTRALVDADMVISLRRNWPKGYLRRTRALLALNWPHDAKKAAVLGLSFEGQNAELLAVSSECDAAIAKLQGDAASLNEKSETV